MVVNTLGYQGLQQDSFFELLQNNQVSILIDVRENPISRKKGFSKSNLSSMAKQKGIEYIHIRSLGSPREIRHEYKATNDWNDFSIKYSKYLDSQSEGMTKLADLVQQKNCCLICFESDPQFCHRSILAERLHDFEKTDIQIIHLSRGEEK